MATPIAPTPMLRGKEAERFRRNEIRNRGREAPVKQVRKAIKAFLKFTER